MLIKLGNIYCSSDIINHEVTDNIMEFRTTPVAVPTEICANVARISYCWLSIIALKIWDLLTILYQNFILSIKLLY